MTTLSFSQRIACAAATLFGRYGAVTRIAQAHGLCRQSVYRQADAVRDDLDAQTHRQEILRLRQQLEQTEARCADWQRRLDDAVVLDQDRQAEFASKFGFSSASVRNWEQGRRRPEGPARVLLAVIDRHPDAVEDALRLPG